MVGGAQTLEGVCYSCGRVTVSFVILQVAYEGRGRRCDIPISTAPAVEPAMIDRTGVGPFLTGCDSSCVEAIVTDAAGFTKTDELARAGRVRGAVEDRDKSSIGLKFL